MMRRYVAMVVVVVVLTLSVGCGPATDPPVFSWRPQSSGSSETLNTVVFADPQYGWAAGERGTILATDDGGNTWTPQTSGSEVAVFGMDFADRATGCAVGWNPDDWLALEAGIVLRSGDGGSTWRTLGEGKGNLFDVELVNADLGWAVGNLEDGALIIATEDSAASWSRQYSGGRDGLYGVDFADDYAGCAVGGRTALSTDDGGLTWRRRELGKKMWIVDVACAPGTDEVWCVGENGAVLVSSDGGLTWQRQDSGVDVDLNAVDFTDATHGWAVGDKGTVIATKDAGATWVLQDSGTNRRLYSVFALNASRAWAVGAKGTIVSMSAEGAKK
ncbi:MAG TPA: YCF48-related protein [Thermoleophilia bacterium]